MSKNWMILNGSDVVIQATVSEDDDFDPGSPWIERDQTDYDAYLAAVAAFILDHPETPYYVVRVASSNYDVFSNRTTVTYEQFLHLWTWNELQVIENLRRNYSTYVSVVTSGGSSVGVAVEYRDVLNLYWRWAEIRGTGGLIPSSVGTWVDLCEFTVTALLRSGFYFDSTESDARLAQIVAMEDPPSPWS